MDTNNSEVPNQPAIIERNGYDRLWLWFELSRASWLTIPRVLLHQMPDEWQGKMAALLEEYSETFSGWPEGLWTRVEITEWGHPTTAHNWLNNYRHPNRERIANLRSDDSHRQDRQTEQNEKMTENQTEPTSPRVAQTAQHVKDLSEVLDRLKRDSDSNYTGHRPPDHPVRSSRARSIAITKLEEAIMWLDADRRGA